MSNEKTSGAKWLWGTVVGIAACMIFFVGLAIWSSFGEVELVHENYYAKDQAYDEQIKRIERTQALAAAPQFLYTKDSKQVQLIFPAALGGAEKGSILLYSPADLRDDRRFELNLAGDTLQALDVPGLRKGLWRIKLDWQKAGLEYYLEGSIYIQD